MKQTIRSQCPICEGVIDSLPVKYGMKAITACPHCATLVELGVEVIATHEMVDKDGKPLKGKQCLKQR